MRKILSLALFVSAFAIQSPSLATKAQAQSASGSAPNVVVTIRPVHSLVSQLMEGVGKPELLLKGQVSPHDFALTPSMARTLQKADVLVWVGKQLETPLAKKLSTLAATSTLIELMDAKGLTHVEMSEHDHHDHGHGHGHGHSKKAKHAEDKHGKDEGHKDDHSAEADLRDPHIWLSPRNARAAARAIAEKLAKRDPANAKRYEENLTKTIADLKKLDGEVAAILAPAKNVRFAATHDAWRHFTNTFSLEPAVAVNTSDNRPVTPGRLKDVRNNIKKQGVTCLIADPEAPRRLRDQLARDLDLKIVKSDPLGTEIESGPDLYATLLRQTAENLVVCARAANG